MPGIITSSRIRSGRKRRASVSAAFAVAGVAHLVAAELEHLAADQADRRIVVDDQHARRLAAAALDEAQARVAERRGLDRELEHVVGAGGEHVGAALGVADDHHGGLVRVGIVLEDREQRERVGHRAGDHREGRVLGARRSRARCRRRSRRARGRRATSAGP